MNLNVTLNELELKIINTLAINGTLSINEIMKIIDQKNYNTIYHAIITLIRFNLIVENNYLFTINSNNDFIKNKYIQNKLEIQHLKELSIKIDENNYQYKLKYKNVKNHPMETIGFNDISTGFSIDDLPLINNLHNAIEQIRLKLKETE